MGMQPRGKGLPIDDVLIGLRARRVACVLEIIALEAGGAVPADEAPASDRQVAAHKLLAGAGFTISPPETPASVRLAALFKERDATDLAIEIGERQAHREHAEKQRAEIEARAGEWAELTHQLVLAVVAVRRITRARDDFRRSVTRISTPTLPCDGFKLLGDGLAAAWTPAGVDADRLVAAALKAGFVTKKEIQNA